MDPISVVVKSAWASKINWTQGVGLLASLLAMRGVDLPPETQAQIVVGVQALVSVATWVARTWFTTSVTPSVAKKIAA
jgi:hypothetical protein